MDYYVILYVDLAGRKNIRYVVESEEAAKQFCKDMNELYDGYRHSHYTYMGREQFLDERLRNLLQENDY